MVAKKKTKSTRKKKWVEPDWDPWYIRMMDAVGEYMDMIGHRADTEITDRDFIIIKALIEFYGFDSGEMKEMFEDLDIRAEQLKRELENGNH